MDTPTLTYKRGVNTIDMTDYLCPYTFKYKNLGIITERVWFVHFGDKLIGHISYCKDLREHTCYPDNDSDYIAGGLTLKECKESITRYVQKHLV